MRPGRAAALAFLTAFVTLFVFFDLLGSSLGALAVVPAIVFLGVETGLLAAGALMVVGTALLAPPLGRTVRALGVAALALLAASAVARARVFDMSFPEGSMLAATRDPRSGMELEHTAWDPRARIEVSRIPPPQPDRVFYPVLLGTNREFLARCRSVLTQNNYAFTYAPYYDGNPRSLAAFAPWAWGINGIFSVLAPVTAVALSITWGINALLLSAIPVYLAVGWAFPTGAPALSPLPDPAP